MGNVNMEAYQIHTTDPTAPNVQKALDKLKSGESSIAQDIETLSEAISVKADRIDIAPTFSEESTYFAGDVVYHSNRLWVFDVGHDPGEWDQSEVSATNVDMLIRAGGGGGAVDYSTTEQLVGKWIDGSDLYQKTFVLREGGVDQYTYSTLNYDLGQTFAFIFIKDFQCVRTTGNYIDCSSWANEVHLVPGTDGLVYSPYSSRFKDIYMTICYVKPTTP